MSNFMITSNNKSTFHWRLLSTVSALALIASAQLMDDAKADEADNPAVWLELGGQLEQSGSGDTFAPPFITSNDWSGMHLPSPASIQNMQTFSYGGEGSLTFRPAGTNWDLTASVRYGRSIDNRHSHVQPKGPRQRQYDPYFTYYFYVACCKTYYHTPPVTNYEDTAASKRESHLIVDFQAGKDVGLGLFGRGSSSVISAGVRLARFQTRSSVVGHAHANTQFYNGIYAGYYPYFQPPITVPVSRYHRYSITGESERNFNGIGPSIAWKGSAPLAGNLDSGEMTFDWGVNAAILFGRQKARVRHQTTGNYHFAKYHNALGLPPGTEPHYQHSAAPSRSRSVTVPNVGGFAGLSFRYTDAKISLGYRADLFIGAMDIGIDAAKKSNVLFHGPYASISFGLGD